MARDGLLPANVTGPIDLNRLLREAKSLDEFLTSAGLRVGGEPVKLPKTSRNLDDLTTQAKLNILHEADRQELIRYLTDIKDAAPTIHISFSADPSPAFLIKLVTWLRREIHPQLLLRVGLQPNLGAGCIVRTTNKYFDFSLRQHFADKSDVFLKRLQAAVQQVEAGADK